MRRLSLALLALACLVSPSWADFVVDSGRQVRSTINLETGSHLVRPTVDGANVLRVQTSGSVEVLGVATDTPMVRAASLTIGTGGHLYLGAGSVRANGTQHLLSQAAGTNLITLGSSTVANGLSLDSSSGVGRFTVSAAGNGYFAGTLTTAGILYAGSGGVALTVADGHIASTALPTLPHSGLSGLTADDHPLYLRADGGRALTGNLPAGGYRITGLGTPSAGSDAATMAYVDSRASGITWAASVLDKDLSTPPGTPAVGQRYIVWPTGTGAWATHDNAIAEWSGAAWTFTPASGAQTTNLALLVGDEAKSYVFNGTAWVSFGGAVAHADVTGPDVGDYHTQYARLAGRGSGQTLYGSNVASGNLTLGSTSHATKGSLILADLIGTGGFLMADSSGHLYSSSAVNLASQVGGLLPVISGGTGAGTAAGARVNLGLDQLANVPQVQLQAATPAASQTGGLWVTGAAKAGSLEATAGGLSLPQGQAVRAGANWMLGQTIDGTATNRLGSDAISNPLAIYTNTGAPKATLDAAGVLAVPSIVSGVVKSAGGTLSGGAAASDLSGWPAAVDMTELGRLDGVTSGIQAQLNAKEGLPAGGDWTSYLRGDRTWQPFTAGVRGLVSATAPLTYNGTTGTFGLSVGPGVGQVADGPHNHDTRYSLLGHVHSSLAASGGSPDPALSVDAVGVTSMLGAKILGSGAANLILNTPVANTYQAFLTFADAAVAKWTLGKQADDNSFFLWDQGAGLYNLQALPSGRLSLSSSNGNLSLTANGAGSSVLLPNLSAGGVVGATATTGALSIVAATADLTSAISQRHAAVTAGTGIGLSGQQVSVTYGTTAGTSAQGNDSRFHDAVTAGAGVSLSGQQVSVTYGSTAGTAAQGNDARFHSAVTLGASSGGLTLAGQALSSQYADSTHDGMLASGTYNSFAGKEPGLGNPATDGMVLSSTAAGVRSWKSLTNTNSVVRAGISNGIFPFVSQLTSNPSDGWGLYDSSLSYGPNGTVFCTASSSYPSLQVQQLSSAGMGIRVNAASSADAAIEVTGTIGASGVIKTSSSFAVVRGYATTAGWSGSITTATGTITVVGGIITGYTGS
ncbi:MAG TPA: DUF2793 domain-containing protein [Armatimonadota bacterium]|jgi:hypothetical protein